MEFRKLRADEIDLRAATVKENGVSLLLYKDARCDMNILDETVGAMNWQRSHSRDNANCTVSIWDETKGVWVSKEDTGTESYSEKEKGLASDSFKRACFNWGIGRELYTSPFIWISNKDCEIKEVKGKLQCRDNFSVKSIGYDENGAICLLAIVNDKTRKVVFQMGKEKVNDTKENRTQLLNKIYVLIEQTQTNEAEICAYFDVGKIQDMKTEDLNECVYILEQKKKK